MTTPNHTGRVLKPHDDPHDAFSLAAAAAVRLNETQGVVEAVGARSSIRFALGVSGDRATQPPLRIWVLPAAEQPAAAADVDEDGPGQALTLRVTVLHIAATYNMRGGGDAAGDLDDMREATRAALAGWVPPGATAPLRFAGGRLTAIGELVQGGRAWWADDYSLPVWLPYDVC